MRIRRMRFVLPARMRGTAHADAHVLARAAARALQTGAIDGASVTISGGGRPAVTLAREMGRTAGRTRHIHGRKD